MCIQFWNIYLKNGNFYICAATAVSEWVREEVSQSILLHILIICHINVLMHQTSRSYQESHEIMFVLFYIQHLFLLFFLFSVCCVCIYVRGKIQFKPTQQYDKFFFIAVPFQNYHIVYMYPNTLTYSVFYISIQFTSFSIAFLDLKTFLPPPACGLFFHFSIMSHRL